MKGIQNNSREKGFAMLFAVLVSSVLLSVGVSIFNLTIKELILSSSGRESQFAFYAADTGIECAIYWDFKAAEPGTMYATSTDSAGSWRETIVDTQAPTCVGVDLAPSFKNPVFVSPSPVSATTQFELTIPNEFPVGTPAPYCAIVTVTKATTGGITTTTISSRGYNMGCSSTDQNKIERALKVTY